ncbi:NUDIX hydrolase [Rhizobium sp. BK377]|jgi:8-oxo-dGTP diphosphatase|uniref:NUDIX hydrolase n=1 Tax=Rhizobium sp. BK377 TaxID=2587058 RepID=UPI00161CD0C0|nr:NUDIX hydrolase [Rhizobium sp. BK377]MBB3464552.1 mutator protein MutT [Rhizobium sp. BK377]
MRPIVGAMAIVFRREEILMIRRAKDPEAGLWSLPAGKIELGETMQAAAVRELAEETAVVAVAQRVLAPVEAMERDEAGRIKYHIVITPVLCVWTSGEPFAGDDAAEARWVKLADVNQLNLVSSFNLARLIALAAAPEGGCANKPLPWG